MLWPTMTDARPGGAQTSAVEIIHDAFISYSRADRPFAAALESALEGYRPPRELGVPYRYLEVFRDEEDFTGTEYTSAVTRHLAASRKLIVICTPAARASRFVAEEIRLFAAVRGAEHIIPILLSGIPNNEGRTGREQDFAFPDALCDVMAMPLAASFLGYASTGQRLNRPPFEGAWLTVLANLYGIERSDLEQRERRRQLRARRIWTSAVTAIVLALSALTVWALLSRQDAVRQRLAAERAAASEAIAAQKERVARQEAERQRQIALTRQLAAQAELTINQEPNRLTRSVLLAAESLHPDHQSASLESYQALRHGLRLLPPRPARLHPKGRLPSLVVSPDGGFFATLSRLGGESVVTLFANTAAGRVVDELRDSDTSLPIAAIAVSPGGRHVALVRARGVDIWRPRSGEPSSTVARAQLPGASVVRFSPDGRFVAALSRQGGLASVWDVGGWTERRLGDPFTTLTFSPDGLLSLVGRSTIVNWDFNNGTSRVPRCDVGSAKLAAFSPDATHAALLDDAGMVHVVRLGAGREGRCTERARIAAQDGVTSLAISPAGRVLAVGSSDGTARVWTVADARELAWMTHDGAVISLDFDGTGQRLITTDVTGVVTLWSVVSGSESREFRHSDEVIAAAFGSGAKTLATATKSGAVQVWTLESAAAPGPARVVHEAFVTSDDLRGSFEPAPEVGQVAFSPGGLFFGAVTSEDELIVWDVRAGSMRRTSDVPSDEIDAISISGDGALAAAVMKDGTLLVMRSGQRASVNSPAAADVRAAAFEPAGQRLATIDANETVALRRPDSWRPAARLSPDGAVDRLVWGAGGQYLATVTGQHVVRVWDVRSGQVSGQLPLDRKDELRALSRDGAFVATISGNRASVWDVRTGSELARLTHGGAVRDIAFSDDGRLVATASADLTARVWLWHPKDLVAAACERLTVGELDAEDWRTFLGAEPRRPTCAPEPASRD